MLHDKIQITALKKSVNISETIVPITVLDRYTGADLKKKKNQQLVHTQLAARFHSRLWKLVFALPNFIKTLKRE